MLNDASLNLARRMQYPNAVAQTQAEYDRRRLAAVENALLYRPTFLPTFHTLPAAAQAAPIVEITDDQKYPVVVTGAITDGEQRNVRFYKERSPRSLINFGSTANLKLSLDAIAGHSVASAGYAGVKDYDEPFYLNEGQYLTLEVFQETSPGATEQVATCFNGFRCFTPDHAEAQLSPDTRAKVLQSIAGRPAPETKYALCAVAFGADGNATADLPESDEPMMILGHRATFSDALVSIGFSREFTFSKQAFPIWALCAEKTNANKIWEYLPTPLFVPPREQLRYVLSNSIDGSVIATDGNIEVLLQTM